MNYKHMCIIDKDNFYKTLVLVLLEQDEKGKEIEQIQYYTLKEGESLVDTGAPSTKPYAGADGIIKPLWNGTAWVEGATAEESSDWEIENPAPPAPEPSPMDMLNQQVEQLTLSNQQKDQVINALGEQLVQTKLDVMAIKSELKGGVQ